jgi:FixJ family two-component response regulator
LQKTFAIAVIDDDDSIREAVAGLVKSLGYRVVAFGRAEDFLQFEQRSAIACLIADVQMPGMTGPDLHTQLVASGEPIPTILITAYPDNAVRKRAFQNGVKCYLTKPFREEDLIECIQAALDSQPTEEVNGD